MKVDALIMDPKDNVVTCVRDVKAGEVVHYRSKNEDLEILAKEAIPFSHKISLTDLEEGQEVIKYGELIGKTTRKINAGCLVDHNNIYSVPRDYESELVEEKGEEPVEIKKSEKGEKIQFLGYRRFDGRVGIRNHVLILPACACGSESSRIVASQVRGAVNIVFNTGCSDVAEGGTLKTIEKATRAARKLAAQAGLVRKEWCDISELLMGIECGGSDATSGIASNPAVGELSDLLVDLGASTIMSESIEWIGGEHIVAKRGATPKIHNQVIRVCEEYEKHLKQAGQDCRAGQPTPGNKAGGLSTLDEKSLGCIRKGGTRPIVEVLEQAVRPSKHGAIVMDTAGYDISSVTSMVAAGCACVIFTTGRGTPTGNAIAPVLKVTANKRTYTHMEDNMDVDLSGIIEGTKTIEESGKMLLDEIVQVCNGKLTKAEAYGFSDIAVDHVCRFV